jgi:hypothetical protein
MHMLGSVGEVVGRCEWVRGSSNLGMSRGWVGVGVAGAEEYEKVKVGMVTVLASSRPTPTLLVWVLLSTLLVMMVVVWGVRACACRRQLACAELGEACTVYCASLECLWGGW